MFSKPNRSLALAFVFAVLVVCTFGAPTAAMAVEIQSSATDHLDAADIRVTLDSTDPTGTVLLLIDGTVFAARPAIPSSAIDYGKVELPVGHHELEARLMVGRESTHSASVDLRVWAEPLPSVLVRPSGYASVRAETAVKVGLGATRVDVYLNGKLVNVRAVRENSLASMGMLELGPGLNTVKLVSSNPVASVESTFKIRRLEFPWPTCIIIDKSEYTLYWVRDGILVKTYPIAVGKAHTPTPEAIWRIDAKYHTDPTGVFGPRKMRLFRQYSGGYTYTAYGIHGTNQPWVIPSMASHGCIRMYNDDVLELFPQVPLGTMVQTRQ